MKLDTSGWSGEGAFTQILIDELQAIAEIGAIRVEDAPASRSEADYNFISNEIFVSFAVKAVAHRERRFGLFPVVRTVAEPLMTIPALEEVLTASAAVGAPDYSDEGMMQYLRAERVIPPYQTRGYKLVELVRIYQNAADDPSAANARS